MPTTVFQGNYLPNGQTAKSGLNKFWFDASFGQFFDIFSYIAEKAGAVVKKVNPVGWVRHNDNLEEQLRVLYSP